MIFLLSPSPCLALFRLCLNQVEMSDFGVSSEHDLSTLSAQTSGFSLLGDKFGGQRMEFSFKLWPQQGLVCLGGSNVALVTS